MGKMANQGKLLTKFNPGYIRVFKSLHRNLSLKIIKYQNIFLSFNRNIVCKNIFCVIGLRLMYYRAVVQKNEETSYLDDL
jgi:hypothetical protein